MEATFTAGEASRLAGFTKPWMLGHLEREGTFVREYVGDRRHGRARKYTFADVVILRSINRLLELGARPARIKAIICRLGQKEGLCGTREKVETLSRSLGSRLFITDKDALVLDDDQQLLDLFSSGQLAFGFMVDFHECVRPVAEVIEVYEKRRQKLWKQNKAILDELCAQKGI